MLCPASAVADWSAAAGVCARQVFKLTGSRDRWESQKKDTPPDRWWPWTYEVRAVPAVPIPGRHPRERLRGLLSVCLDQVLIAQWRALVRIYQEVDVEFIRRSASNTSGGGERRAAEA